MALTADVPKVSRVAGLGIVKLARKSGRPIYPVAVATSRRVELDNWDRSDVNLPFGRFAIAVGDPIRIEAEADETAQERARLAIEAGLERGDRPRPRACRRRQRRLKPRRSMLAARGHNR